jgi:hypothetical protein
MTSFRNAIRCVPWSSFRAGCRCQTRSLSLSRNDRTGSDVVFNQRRCHQKKRTSWAVDGVGRSRVGRVEGFGLSLVDVVEVDVGEFSAGGDPEFGVDVAQVRVDCAWAEK